MVPFSPLHRWLPILACFQNRRIADGACRPPHHWNISSMKFANTPSHEFIFRVPMGALLEHTKTLAFLYRSYDHECCVASKCTWEWIWLILGEMMVTWWFGYNAFDGVVWSGYWWHVQIYYNSHFFVGMYWFHLWVPLQYSFFNLEIWTSLLPPFVTTHH